MLAYDSVWPILLRVRKDGSISAERSNLSRESFDQCRSSPCN